MSLAETSVNSIGERREDHPHDNVGVFLPACPIETLLLLFDIAIELVFVVRIKGTSGEISWDVPGESD